MGGIIYSKIHSGWYTLPFFPGSFGVYFHVQIKPSCKSKKFIVFLWCRQGQNGTGGTEIYIFLTVGRNKGT